MADEKKTILAKQVYATLCEAIEERNWTYEKDEEKLIVHFDVNGHDIPMHFLLIVDVEKQLIRLLSPVATMSEEKRIDGAIAACCATYGLADGSFDYDVVKGSVMFRMTASFRQSTVGTRLFEYMIDCSCFTVDKYNDKFLALNKGVIDVADFINE